MIAPGTLVETLPPSGFPGRRGRVEQRLICEAGAGAIVQFCDGVRGLAGIFVPTSDEDTWLRQVEERP